MNIVWTTHATQETDWVTGSHAPATPAQRMMNQHPPSNVQTRQLVPEPSSAESAPDSGGMTAGLNIFSHDNSKQSHQH